MGVIHKLREDVVSFIIARKTSDPAVSVRCLADLTSEQFKVKVSKSSVSSVLKRASLSSSVGRRSGGANRAETFSIPTAKKDQILKNMQKAGFIKEQDVFVKEQEEQIPVRTTEKPLEQKSSAPNGPAEKQPSLLEEGSREETNEPDAIKEALPKEDAQEGQVFLDRVREARDQKEKGGKQVSDGIGFIFLKAAQWEISRRSLMGDLFRKHIKSAVSSRFDAVSDMFLFFKFLGVEEFDHISAYRDHGLWVLNNFCDSNVYEARDLLELQELFQWFQSIQQDPLLPDFIMEYNETKEQAFLEVKGFRLLLEDRSELTVDALMASFGGGGAFSFLEDSSLPINKAMENLSNCLISNIQSVVFQRVPGETRIDRTFYDMAAFFENIPGKRVIKTSVISQKNEEIAKFSTVPSQKRTFLAGISPNQKEFTELTKSAKWSAKKSFYHPKTDQIVHLAETKTDFLTTQVDEKIGDCRVVTLWRENEEVPFWAILTNQHAGGSEEILEIYMTNWPYLDKSFRQDSTLALPEGSPGSFPVQPKGSPGNFNIFPDLVNGLHDYCQRHFFPAAYSKIDVNNLITSIYGLPGIYNEGEGTIRIALGVDKSSAYRKDLEYAVKRVNERNISDYTGRRLWLTI